MASGMVSSTVGGVGFGLAIGVLDFFFLILRVLVDFLCLVGPSFARSFPSCGRLSVDERVVTGMSPGSSLRRNA